MMDSVPVDFSERVLATRKCGEQKRCSCPDLRFAARNWNQQMEQKPINLSVGVSGGKWTYAFYGIPSLKSLSLDEVMRLKNVRVIQCDVWTKSSFEYAVLDLEKLLKVVSFLSNEPSLHVYQSEDDFGCSQCQKLLKWLLESWFASVYVSVLTPLRCQIVENQFSRWKPTAITVGKMQENAAFLENRLKSGDLRRFSLHDSYEFPSAVLVRIIYNVLEGPEDYRRYGLDICVCFDHSAGALMNEMTENGRCRREARDRQHYKYILDNQAPVLIVENLSEHRWKLKCVGQQN